jgi:butyryl-CoA dehydrogenase
MTDRDKGHKGISAFVVPMDAKGLVRAKPDEKLGIRASGSCSLFFEECLVPKKNRIGDEGDGFKVAMSTLDAGRIGIAAQAVGIARAAFDEAVNYARIRKTFGKPIAEHQAIAFMLADMATEIDAARMLIFAAAVKKDRGERHTQESAMAKLYASEMSGRVTTKALQIHGGYGYTAEFDVERHFRDAKITELYEGTSEIQRMVISNALVKD